MEYIQMDRHSNSGLYKLISFLQISEKTSILTVPPMALYFATVYLAFLGLAAAPSATQAAPAGLAAAYAFDETGATTTADSSGNGNTGALTNGPESGAGCSTFAQVATPVGTSYSDPGLQASTSYSYRVRAVDAAIHLSLYSNTASVTTLASGTSQVGEWSGPSAWPLVAVHMMLLHNGEILAWGGSSDGFDARLWNPETDTFRSAPNTSTNLFCSGHAVLRDGRVFVAGGHVANHTGLSNANIFNPATRGWASATSMSFPRWYPTATTLPDGRVLVTAGEINCPGASDPQCVADIPEIYNATTNAWTQLTNAKLFLPWYPHMYVLPDGKVLAAATSEASISTRVLDVNTQTWTMIDPIAVDGGSSAMYLPGKIIKSGTSSDTNLSVPSSANAYVLDMTQPSPAWRQTTSMAFPRTYHNLTILPDGHVLVTGGGTMIMEFRLSVHLSGFHKRAGGAEQITKIGLCVCRFRDPLNKDPSTRFDTMRHDGSGSCGAAKGTNGKHSPRMRG